MTDLLSQLKFVGLDDVGNTKVFNSYAMALHKQT